MITKLFRPIQCIKHSKSHIQCISMMNNNYTCIQRHNNSNWSMSAVTEWMTSKIQQEKLAAKQLKLTKKKLSKLSDPSEIEQIKNENSNLLVMDENENDEDALIQESDTKSGKIKFQRNVPGQPTIYDGETIGQLQNVKKTKKGNKLS
eukprot:UN10536